jgi:septal ring factor EnvC (AmiA/AmiB activator)
VKADAEAAVLAMDSRVADLRRIEADLETVRQAHYAAGDQVNQAQGLLYEASTEVGKLEAEIRFVVEGRQRVEQRLATLQGADRAVGRAPPRRRGRNPQLMDRSGQAQETAPCWPPRSRTTRNNCRSWRTPCVWRSPRQRAALP